MNKNILYLKEKALQYNIVLDDTQLEQFETYWKILDEYNKHTNLVGSTDPEMVFGRHFLDSLSIGLLKDNLKFNKIIDIGIGGGFPGIPILIAFPSAKLCGVDSVGKKIKFLEMLSGELDLKDRTEFLNTRAEELARNKDYRDGFDIAVTRAVGPLSLISDYCLPFVKPRGYFVAYKAKNINEEINNSKTAFSKLGSKFIKKVSYELSEKEEIERNLILVEKTGKTPPPYPRKTGIPAKLPL